MKRDKPAAPAAPAVSRRSFVIGALAAMPVGRAFAQGREWPTKTISVVIGVAPGSILDVTTRAIAAEMSKLLEVPIVAVNAPGGGGGIAADTVFRAPNDGYTWHAQGSAFRNFAVMGLHSATPKEWYCLPTVTYVAAVSVRADSPYKTLPDLVEALKKEPGKIPYSASLPGTAYRLSMEIMRSATGLSGRFVSYPGAAAGQVATLSGDVQYLCSGIGEQAELLRGKKLRALAAFDTKPYHLKGYGDIPAITDFLPALKPHLPYQGWSSLSFRADTPKPVLKKIDATFLKAVQAKPVKDLCEKFEAPILGVVGEEAQAFYLKQSALECWKLYELGIAKRSPADFGIPKP